MKTNFERRRCHRFEIPDAYVRYHKRGFWAITSQLSGRKSLINISKGGLCFEGDERVQAGDKVTVYLYLPHGVCWAIKGAVEWKQGDDHSGFSVGVKFAAYKNGYGYNSPETLDALRSLESLYLNTHNELSRVA